MYTRMIRKIVTKATYGFGHCSGDNDGNGTGHCC